jgi:hypothetical protein
MKLALLLLVAGVLAVPATAAAQPTVRFASLVPVSVRGAHFVPGEHVRVTLLAGKTRKARTATATARGVFTLAFGTIAHEDRCSGSMSLVALGARGDRAVYKLPQLACPVQGATKNG